MTETSFKRFDILMYFSQIQLSWLNWILWSIWKHSNFITFQIIMHWLHSVAIFMFWPTLYLRRLGGGTLYLRRLVGGRGGGCRMVELNVQDDVIKWKYLSVIGPFSQRPVTRRFYVFFDLRLKKWLNKQLRHWWFETRSLWCHCNMVSHIYIDEMKAEAHDIWYDSFIFQKFFYAQIIIMISFLPARMILLVNAAYSVWHLCFHSIQRQNYATADNALLHILGMKYFSLCTFIQLSPKVIRACFSWNLTNAW